MSNCPHCGKPLKKYSHFCEECSTDKANFTVPEGRSALNAAESLFQEPLRHKAYHKDYWQQFEEEFA